MNTKTKAAILGASGYTGAELLRLLISHPFVEIVALTADRRAGQSMASVYPQLIMHDLPVLTTIKAVDWTEVDLAFCALPHGTTQEIVLSLPTSLKIIDLSADFRLSDPKLYAQWYGHKHQAIALQAEAVYGLTELWRDQVKTARLVANPGCYPTSIQLPLIPLLEAEVIRTDDLICDSKSGVTGAGRIPKESTLFCEVSDGIHAYSVASHRHLPEIEQGLTHGAKQPVNLSFTPHLMPMNRGILSTCYVRVASGKTPEDLWNILAERYRNEAFVHVLPFGATPQTRHVRASNHVMIGVCPDHIPGRAIIVSVIDNLVKGASGQAVQNMNVMQGYSETTGLEQTPLFP